MKWTLEELKQRLDTQLSAQEIAEALTNIGHEVEDVQTPCAYDNIVVAHIVDVQTHPQADRLNLCTVDDGSGKQLSIVCGGTNVEKGMYGLLAREGAIIPSTGTALKKGVIRGVASEGMLCSAEELCLNIPAEKGAIIKLDKPHTPGTPARDVLPSSPILIDVSLTPNRGDCWSIYGLARDLAACGYGTLRPRPMFPSISWDASINMRVEVPAYFTLSELHLNSSSVVSPWKHALESMGQRSSHPMVDLTNYAAITWGQPMHAFDADCLKGPLVLRMAKEGETLEALDGKTYSLTTDMMVLADDQGVQALPGLMGGQHSAVSDATKRVYLEAAWFDPDIVAQTGQKLRLTSDARTRFERGVDPQGVLPTLQWALDACKGWAQLKGATQAGQLPQPHQPIEWHSALLTKHLGIDIPNNKHLFEQLGCVVEGSHVTPPSWRSDIRIPMDLVEEAARLHGYQNIPHVSLPTSTPQSVTIWTDDVRHALTSRSFFEVMTWSMVSHEDATLMGGGVPLLEPLTQDMAEMRATLMTGLLQAAARNQTRHDDSVNIFEWAHVYHPKEQTMVAGLRAHQRPKAHWLQKTGTIDFYTVKADVWSLLESLHIKPDTFQVEAAAPQWYHPHQCCTLKKGPRVLGYLGTLHPRIIKHFGLKGTIVGFELFSDVLHDFKRKPSGQLPSVYQAVVRDFCFVMPHSQSIDDMLRHMAQLPHVTRVDVADVYVMNEKERSVLFQVTLQPQDRTLADNDIQEVCQKLVESSQQKWGIQLRAG